MAPEAMRVCRRLRAGARRELTFGAIDASFGAAAADLEFEVTVLDRTIRGLTRSCGDAPVGTLFAILGPSGRLEVAQVGGAACDRLGLGEGDVDLVRRRT